MKKSDINKKIVLGILFIFPLLVYLFFASGKNNFAKLPVLSSGLIEINKIDSQILYNLKIKLPYLVIGVAA